MRPTRHAYYAHSMRTYGRQQERRELAILRFWHRLKLTNPNGLLEARNWKETAHDLISECDIFIFSEYRKHMGRGVTGEIAMAQYLGKPIYVLRGWRLFPVAFEDVQILNINWAVQFARLSGVS